MIPFAVTMPKKFKRFEKIVEREFNRAVQKPENWNRLNAEIGDKLQEMAREMCGNPTSKKCND